MARAADREFLTPNDAARRVTAITKRSYSADAIRAAERRGALRAIRTPGGIRLFDVRDVETFARERLEAQKAMDAA